MDVQRRIQAAADEMTGGGAETGLQVCVIEHGRVAADVVSGTADPRTGAPVAADTLFWSGSTAKGVAATVAHVLAERGELDYDMRAAEVWPEFGSGGKSGVTVRQVLLHTAGVPGLPPGTTADELRDWDRMCALLARETPWWEPGTRFGYHAKTFGFLIGEIVRRATGRSIGEALRSLVTGPLGIEDEVHFGVPRRLLGRVAWQVQADGPAPVLPEPGSALDRAMPPGVVPDASYANRPDLLTADIPSEGTMTARGVALVYAALLDSDAGLVSASRLASMAAVTFSGFDEVMGFESSWAFGYSPSRPGGAARPGTVFGMAGMNGSFAYADIEAGMAVAVLRNQFPGDFTAAARIDQIVRATQGADR